MALPGLGNIGRARVGGSGLTLYRFSLTGNSHGAGGTMLAFCRQASHTAPTPVGTGVTAIHPMDRQYPVQLVTPQAQTMGSITLEFYEPTDKMFWQLIPDLAKYQDLVDVFVGVASHYKDTAGSVDVSKYIIDPATSHVISPAFNSSGGSASSGVTYAAGKSNEKFRTITYHGCVISSLDESEAIDVSSIEVLKRLTINYRYWTVDNKG